MSRNKNITVEKIFNLALENHQANKIDVAQNLYDQVLEIDPTHTNATNNLGVLFQSSGEIQKAKSFLEKTTKLDPNHLNAHNNLGKLYKELEEYQKAKKCYEKVIEIDPNYLEGHNNLGLVNNKLGECQKAISCFEKVIEIDPNYLEGYNNLGLVNNKLGERQKAISCFEKAIEIDPNYSDAHNNLGIVFKELGEISKAITCYERTIEINPNHSIAYNNLAVTFIGMGEFIKAEHNYKKALMINPDSIIALSNLADFNIGNLNNFKTSISLSYKSLKLHHKKSKFLNNSVSLFRLKHDVEQAKYLTQTGRFWKFFKSKSYKINGIDEFQKIGDEILDRKENKNISNQKILLNEDEINALLPFYKSDHIYQTKNISGGCINPNKNWQEIEDQYFNSSNQIIYIDDFLSENALIELRKFCLVSKVWNKEYDNKYLGAFSDKGFNSPVHLQIALDLKEKLPKLFGPHKINKFWGFKYDSTLGSGINIHADFAFHNLNFWITPDKYNNNKNSGGLKIYDVPAPENWTFYNYNIGKKEKIYKFLEDNNANCVNIPYKFNRAVLFNSAYFHETDKIDFKDKYEGRRINNTYLFGTRFAKQN